MGVPSPTLVALWMSLANSNSFDNSFDAVNGLTSATYALPRIPFEFEQALAWVRRRKHARPLCVGPGTSTDPPPEHKQQAVQQPGLGYLHQTPTRRPEQ